MAEMLSSLKIAATQQILLGYLPIKIREFWKRDRIYLWSVSHESG